jgi:hypothetical protein
VELGVVEARELGRAGDVEDLRLRVAADELGQHLVLAARDGAGDGGRHRDRGQPGQRGQDVAPPLTRALGVEHRLQDVAPEQDADAEQHRGRDLHRQHDHELAPPGGGDQLQGRDREARDVAPTRRRLDVFDVDRHTTP